MSDATAVLLGRAEEFERLPAPVFLAGRSWFLDRDPDGYKLLSTVCPHAGGGIGDRGDAYECPHHGWTFAHGSGECLNAPARLSAIPVEQRDGELWASPPPPPEPVRHAGPGLPATVAGDGPVIRLLAHACLEIGWGGFTLLTDPWLWGPAFLGAWTQYPPRKISPDSVTPNAIWISHEHSDHLHAPTLSRLDRDVPVFIPDFPNERMQLQLRELGFEDVRAMPFGEPVRIAPNFTITTFEPGSFWNDAIVLIEVNGYRLLNLNDAGVNRRLAAQIGPVDMIASSFSQSASSYPIVWRHLSEERKHEILEQGRTGSLRMLHDAAEAYGARSVLPFASHFVLWPPEHRSYQEMIHNNTVDNVVESFASSEVEVVDLLPGESYDAGSGELAKRWRDRDSLYTPERIMRHIERSFDQEEFHRHHPAYESLTANEVRGYLGRLNRTPEIAFCEDLVGRIVAKHEGAELISMDFEVSRGRLRVLAEPADEVNLVMEVPAGILERIVKEDISWDEADIGFWCEYERAPDYFHAGFWRVLHAPYYRRPAEPPAAAGTRISEESVIAEVLERHGTPADRIMRRYGLYCVGCRHSTSESIALGARQHGIESEQLTRMIRELNVALLPVAENGSGEAIPHDPQGEPNLIEDPHPTPIG